MTADPRTHPIEFAIIGLSLVFFTTVIPDLITQVVSGGNRKIGWPVLGVLYALLGYVIAFRLPRALSALAAAPALLGLLALPLVSTAWSASPRETAFQAIGLAGSSALAVAMAAALKPIDAIRIAAVGISLSTLASAAAVVLAPEIGIDPSGDWAGSWRGIYEQKNELGLQTALGAIFAGVWLAYGAAGERGIAFGALAVNVAMLSVAQSTTSLLTFAVMLAVMILPLRLVKLTGFAFPCAAVALVAVMVMAPALIAEPVEAFVHWLGKDPSFSNRIPIWTFLWDYIQERPWLGYGYGAFWEDGVLPKSWFQKSLQFTPSTAHNG